ncbi:MAG: TetR/AcrR family transcriptional regulator [Clostridia bacterium]|nr:TetR/AcrR family transcriptional regulator [Clostridia bacterium]
MPKQQQVLIQDEMSETIIEVAEMLATKKGAHTVTVSKILNELEITNRVFYNRFHNIGEVLEIIYKKAVYQMHESIKSEFDIEKDFFEYVMDVTVKVLINTYDIKKQFSHYAFEHDSLTQSNYVWWTTEIKKLVEFGKIKNLVRNDVDPDMLSYSIWCFCRGFNADAVGRNLSKEEAVKRFREGFGYMLNGLKK